MNVKQFYKTSARRPFFKKKVIVRGSGNEIWHYRREKAHGHSRDRHEKQHSSWVAVIVKSLSAKAI